MLSQLKLASLLCFPTVSRAQFDSGQISGFVRESSQAAIPNAIITATNAGNGQQHKTTTNADSYYAFPNLVVGLYTVTAEAPEFRLQLTLCLFLPGTFKVNRGRNGGRLGTKGLSWENT